MKTLLIFILLFSSGRCFAQTDSIPSNAQLQKAMLHMRDNLNKCHKSFKTGAVMSFLGIVLTTSTLAIEDENVRDANGDLTGETEMPSMKQGILITGGLLTLIGSVIVIDSHKHIGRAGRWQFTGDSVIYSFN